jgi:hypothetical protein
VIFVAAWFIFAVNHLGKPSSRHCRKISDSKSFLQHPTTEMQYKKRLAIFPPLAGMTYDINQTLPGGE